MGRSETAATPSIEELWGERFELLDELHYDISNAIVAYCGNISAMYMSANPVHHRWTKHIKLDIHFVRDRVAMGQVRVLHVPTTQQFTNVMLRGFLHRHLQNSDPVWALARAMLRLWRGVKQCH